MSSLHRASWLSFSLLLLFFFAFPIPSSAQDDQLCDSPVSECDPDTDYFPDKVTIKHATATITDLKYSNTYVEFTVVNPTADEDTTWSYRVVKCGCEAGEVSNGVQVLFTSPSRVAVTESPSLSLMTTLLPNIDSLAYCSSFVYNPMVVKRVKDRKTIELSYNPTFMGTDYSLLRDDDKLSASIIGVFDAQAYQEQNVGKSFLVIGEAKDISPLARAEWMKLIGIMFDLSKEAEDKFADIETQYTETKKRAAGAARWPSVFFNGPRKNSFVDKPGAPAEETYVWDQPVERQYISAIVKDANADFRFGFNDEEITRLLSFSEIKGNFSNARFLINVGSGTPRTDWTLETFITDFVTSDAKDDDSFEKLAKGLAAVRCGNVWSNQKKSTPSASDYFESLVFQPDVYLKELVHIFHPYLKKTSDDDLFYSYHLGDATEEVVGSKCPFIDLVGDPPAGKKYVDHSFIIPGMSRFAVEDKAEDKILPQLREELELDENSIELFFTKPDDGDEKDTPLKVRLAVNEADVDDFDNKESVQKVLSSALGEEVIDVDDDDDGGLGAGAIVGIVLACIVVVAVVAFFVIRSRRKRGPPGEPGTQVNDEYVPNEGDPFAPV